MRSTTVVAIVIIAGLGAITAGWVYQSETDSPLTRPAVDIPPDIDYYLAQMKYRAMNETGQLDHELHSRYLEHLTKDDVSHLEEPRLRVYRNNAYWTVEAQTGDMFHQLNQIRLDNDVVMQSFGDRPIIVRADTMLFEPDRDFITSDKAISIEAQGGRIKGEAARFDLRNEIYSLKNTHSVYYSERS